jgi:hypothetical protein
MNHFAATITGASIVLAERTGSGLVAWTIATEARPASFAAADTMLAANGYGRTAAWELDEAGNVSAPVAQIDNLFNGTRAARLDQAVGTTHEEFVMTNASKVENGDLISDRELSALYVVAGSSLETGMKVHMVAEGKTWSDRFTTEFLREELVMVARRKA